MDTTDANRQDIELAVTQLQRIAAMLESGTVRAELLASAVGEVENMLRVVRSRLSPP